MHEPGDHHWRGCRADRIEPASVSNKRAEAAVWRLGRDLACGGRAHYQFGNTAVGSGFRRAKMRPCVSRADRLRKRDRRAATNGGLPLQQS
ncbi:hypothetical protein SDC9_171753 [bioreactor metagenome]|uniref:Uncharacterized protein n=1 Tax=bioreactor metagenome TaxID=1076179 RepID=A0A645GCF5_9ZZZZ